MRMQAFFILGFVAFMACVPTVQSDPVHEPDTNSPMLTVLIASSVGGLHDGPAIPFDDCLPPVCTKRQTDFWKLVTTMLRALR